MLEAWEYREMRPQLIRITDLDRLPAGLPFRTVDAARWCERTAGAVPWVAWLGSSLPFVTGIAQLLLIIVGIGSGVATWRYYHRRRQLLDMHRLDP